MHRNGVSSLFLNLLLSSVAASWDCENLRVKDHDFNFKKLGGAHSVLTSRWESIPQAFHNTTYTLDICNSLKKKGDKKKNEQCPNGTRVCAVTHVLQNDQDEVSEVIALAGQLENAGGSEFDTEVERLKSSDSHTDSQKEGVRVTFKGGKHPLDGRVKERRDQKAIVEFVCNHNMTGLEGEWGVDEDSKRLLVRDDGDDSKDDGDDDGDETESTVEHQVKKDNAALIWESYGPEGDVDVLRLTWLTQYACEDVDATDPDTGEKEESSGSWGFFTWLVIIVFLGVAAYLIFGSWLNYNRFGARGWDLVPHGDTIRDIPYLLKDWMRRVLNTVQGTGSRGGYSAV